MFGVQRSMFSAALTAEPMGQRQDLDYDQEHEHEHEHEHDSRDLCLRSAPRNPYRPGLLKLHNL